MIFDLKQHPDAFEEMKNEQQDMDNLSSKKSIKPISKKKIQDELPPSFIKDLLPLNRIESPNLRRLVMGNTRSKFLFPLISTFSEFFLIFSVQWPLAE